MNLSAIMMIIVFMNLGQVSRLNVMAISAFLYTCTLSSFTLASLHKKFGYTLPYSYTLAASIFKKQGNIKHECQFFFNLHVS